VKAVLFYCDQCDQLVPRGDAEYINGEWQCPRHDRRESEQAKLVTDGGTEVDDWKSAKRGDMAGKWHVWCADCGAKNHKNASKCDSCGYGNGQGTFGVGTWKNVGAPEYTSDGEAGRFKRSVRTDTDQQEGAQ